MNRAIPATLIVAAVIAAPQAVHRLTGGSASPTPADAVVAAVNASPAQERPAYHRLEGAGVAVAIPADYEPHPEHPGFKHKTRDASLLVFSIGEPFSETADRFEPQAMAERGLVFGSREHVQVDGRPAILVTAEQTIDGRAYSKLIVIVAGERRTVLLSATMPRDAVEELSLPLEQAILGAKLDRGGPDVFVDLPLRLDPVAPFAVAAKTEESVVLTRDGHLPAQSADRATFVAGREWTRSPVLDRKAFSEARLGQTQGVRDVTIYAGNYASLAGLPAYELVATARFLEDDAPCFIHQVLAFDGTSVYVLQGVAHLSGGERTLEQFQQMTGTFRPQKATPTLSFSAVP